MSARAFVMLAFAAALPASAASIQLSCNIHDHMLGYIYVVDIPWFAKTRGDENLAAEITVALKALPPPPGTK